MLKNLFSQSAVDTGKIRATKDSFEKEGKSEVSSKLMVAWPQL